MNVSAFYWKMESLPLKKPHVPARKNLFRDSSPLIKQNPLQNGPWDLDGLEQFFSENAVQCAPVHCTSFKIFESASQEEMPIFQSQLENPSLWGVQAVSNPLLACNAIHSGVNLKWERVDKRNNGIKSEKINNYYTNY